MRVAEGRQVLFDRKMRLMQSIHMTQKTNRDGFDLTLSKFKNQSEMARALGVTRAAVTVWRDAGIPVKHIATLKRLTGLRGSQILPETAALLD